MVFTTWAASSHASLPHTPVRRCATDNRELHGGPCIAVPRVAGVRVQAPPSSAGHARRLTVAGRACEGGGESGWTLCRRRYRRMASFVQDHGPRLSPRSDGHGNPVSWPIAAQGARGYPLRLPSGSGGWRSACPRLVRPLVGRFPYLRFSPRVPAHQTVRVTQGELPCRRRRFMGPPPESVWARPRSAGSAHAAEVTAGRDRLGVRSGQCRASAGGCCCRRLWRRPRFRS